MLGTHVERVAKFGNRGAARRAEGARGRTELIEDVQRRCRKADATARKTNDGDTRTRGEVRRFLLLFRRLAIAERKLVRVRRRHHHPDLRASRVHFLTGA